MTLPTVAGRALHYVRDERDGPPLVLLHGAGGNADVWEPLRRELSSFDLFIPSLPGRLGSEGGPYTSVEEAAAWLHELLEALGARAPFVLGHSFGGALALALALRGAPLSGLILVATGARLRVHPSVLQAAEEAVRTRAPISARLGFGAARDEHAARAYEEAAARTPPEATWADLRACDGFDRMGRLGEIEAPALVLGGSDDPLTPPKYLRYLADHLPRAQLTLVPGAGHMLPWERPAELGRIVRSFVGGVG